MRYVRIINLAHRIMTYPFMAQGSRYRHMEAHCSVQLPPLSTAHACECVNEHGMTIQRVWTGAALRAHHQPRTQDHDIPLHVAGVKVRTRAEPQCGYHTKYCTLTHGLRTFMAQGPRYGHETNRSKVSTRTHV